MTLIQNRIASFVPAAMTKVRQLQSQLRGEYDPRGYQSDTSEDLLLKITETNDFIKLLSLDDYAGMTDRQISDTIDFFIDWLTLNEVIAANYQNYFMPVNVDNSLIPTSEYATIQQLNQETIARIATDAALDNRITVLEGLVGAPIFPPGFFSNYNTTYSVVFNDDTRLHTHNNLSVLQQITQTDVDNFQSLTAHFNSVGNPGGLHVSATDRALWNSPVRLGPSDNTNIFYDAGNLTVTSVGGGLFRYTADYSGIFDNRSLVDKGYVLSITNPLTTAISSKLTVSLTGVSTGDVLFFNGTNWVNLGIGGVGTVLTSNGSLPTWSTGVSNGIPAGGIAGQYLKKISGVDYGVAWTNIAVTDISGLTASVAELNTLSGFIGTTTELNYLTGTTSSIQNQLNSKLGNSLVQNALFVGNASNVAAPLVAGSNGYVLTIVSGAPQWVAPTGGGGGSLVDGTYGDITVSGVGTIWTINDDAVTFDKIQNITTQRLVGRFTAGSGSLEQISIGPTLTLTGGALGLAVTGTTGQIPFVNATGNGFSYSSDLFKWDETNHLFIAGSGITLGGATSGYSMIFGSSIVVTGTDYGWSIISGETHNITAIFNDSIAVGESFTISATVGNSAVFGRGHTISGAGNANFNMIVGDNNTLTSTSAAVGNFISGIGNTLNDTSRSAIIGGTGIIGTASDTVYVPNFNINSVGVYASDQRSNYTDRVIADWGNVLSAKTYTGKQTFFSTGTTAGVNTGSVSADPSALVDGDVWYNSTLGKVRVRVGGVTASVGSVSSVAVSSTDLSVSGSPITDSGTITLNINSSAVTYAKLQNSSVGLTVLGRATNSTGVFGEIVAAADGQVLRRSGTSLIFGTIPNASLDNSTIAFATGTLGTDVNWTSSPVALGGTATLNIPDASTSARGLVTTTTQSIGGIKNFSVTSTGSTSTYTFSPSITATANSQRMTALDISPTFATGGFTSTINQGLIVRSGRVGFGTALPASSLQVVGTSTTASTSTFLLQDSAGTSLLEMLDDGLLRFGSTGSRPTITTSLNTTTPNKGGASFLFNAAGSIPHIFTAPSTGVAELMRYFGGITTSSASAAYVSQNITPVINQTGTANGDISGIKYDPTLTGLLGNLYGLLIIPTQAKNGFGVSSPTAKIHVAGGSASVGSAPIKINSGTAMLAPEDGAMEYHSSHLFFTIGSTRYQLDQGGADIQADVNNPGATTSITVTSIHTFKYVNTLNSDTTLNITGGTKGSKLEIMVKNDNTSARTITWGTGIIAQSASHLLTQNKTTTFYFLHNGTSFYLNHTSPPL